MSYTLDDFRTAAAADGVNLIPFPDLRRDATSIADEVQRRKEEARYDSSTFEKQKDNMLEEINKKKEEIESLKKQNDEFKRQNPDGSVTPFEDDIKNCEKAIDEYNGKIADLNKDMAKAVDASERLYNARAGLREYCSCILSRCFWAAIIQSLLSTKGLSEHNFWYTETASPLFCQQAKSCSASTTSLKLAYRYHNTLQTLSGKVIVMGRSTLCSITLAAIILSP